MMNTDELAPIEHEPTPQECLRRGIDLVIFSGDKLLGGPQSGIIGGRADMVAKIKKEPFFRAVRCDKLILTTLQESIDQYLETKADPTQADVPVLKFLRTETEELRQRAEAIVGDLPTENTEITIEETLARPGGGTMPRSEFPSIAVKLVPKNQSIPKLARKLRLGTTAIVGYTTDDAILIDLRTVFPETDPQVKEALKSALS
jgi:L-seryl-tRNA(Ser) seleniumtransferase